MFPLDGLFKERNVVAENRRPAETKRYDDKRVCLYD